MGEMGEGTLLTLDLKWKSLSLINNFVYPAFMKKYFKQWANIETFCKEVEFIDVNQNQEQFNRNNSILASIESADVFKSFLQPEMGYGEPAKNDSNSYFPPKESNKPSSIQEVSEQEKNLQNPTDKLVESLVEKENKASVQSEQNLGNPSRHKLTESVQEENKASVNDDLNTNSLPKYAFLNKPSDQRFDQAFLDFFKSNEYRNLILDQDLPWEDNQIGKGKRKGRRFDS